MITELTQDWETRLLEGTSEILCTPGARRKNQGPHKSESDLPMSVRESPGDSLVLGQTKGREHSPLHQQKIGFTECGPTHQPSEQDHLPLQSVSLTRKLP